MERIPDPALAGLHSDILFGVSCSSVAACTAVGYVTDREGTVGHLLIERWNRSRWNVQSVSSSLQGLLDAVSCPSARACIAVGSLGDPAEAANVPLIMRWTGSRWTRMPAAATPPGGFASVACVSSSSCTAVGSTGGPLLRQFPMIERLRGGRWAVRTTPTLRAPYTEGVLSGIACTGATTCTAVGGVENSAGDLTGPLIEHTNGGAWAVQPAPGPPSPLFGSLEAVSCLAGERCMAVGFAGNHPLSERHG